MLPHHHIFILLSLKIYIIYSNYHAIYHSDMNKLTILYLKAFQETKYLMLISYSIIIYLKKKKKKIYNIFISLILRKIRKKKIEKVNYILDFFETL